MTGFVTYTANPTIDIWGEIGDIRPTEKLRTSNVRHDPGGGGVNVARVLRELGETVLSVHLAGGVTRGLFEALVEREKLPSICVAINGDTRICSVVRERSSGREFRFVPAGPHLSPQECDLGLSALAASACDWLVASGSLPPGAPEDHYEAVGRLARQRGWRFALDCSGGPLRRVLASGLADVIKLSRHELEEITASRLSDMAELRGACAPMLGENGPRWIAVTLGSEGAVLIGDRRAYQAKTPHVEVVSTVGAGDSFLAGLIHGFASEFAPQAALDLAVAAGAAACLNPGTQLARLADIVKLRAALSTGDHEQPSLA
ncbi:1-phosphofructokinase family hexose kinase [Alsobacter sp. KACC 23698]|uniref:Phosphofructokinase n=1 Tax=Alsobacter sp. KACC 23698 TaxID=3149229 RepID=A0AAU7JEU6_9HYPH